MTPRNLTLEGINGTLGGNGGQKSSNNRRTSFLDDPLDGFQTFAFESHWQNFKSFYSQH